MTPVDSGIRDFGPGTPAVLHGTESVFTRRVWWRWRLRRYLRLLFLALIIGSILTLYGYAILELVKANKSHAVVATPAPVGVDGNTNGAETSLLEDSTRSVQTRRLLVSDGIESPGAAGAENRPARGASTDCPRADR